MRSEKEVYDIVLNFAKTDKRIRMVTLEGSRTNTNIPPDDFQDFDITFFVTDMDSFTSDDKWLDIFGERLILQKPEDMELFPAVEKGFSYLMLFTDDVKIDLTLLPLELIDEYFTWDKLVKLLLDKDNRIVKPPIPTDIDYHLQKPTQRMFDDCCNEFSKKQHPKAKGDKTKKSNNYLKQNLKLRKIHTKIANMRNDFLHKLTSILANHYKYFCVESLNVQGMMKNHNLARSISDVSFFEFKRMLAYKSAYRGNEVIEADRFYPSSKTCHCCGYKKEFLTLSERIFQCENCGITIDRDYNASLNLKRYAINNIGLVQAEFTPEDLTALQSDLAINRIATSKVDTGIQQKSCL